MIRLPSGTLTFLFTDIEGSTQGWEQHPQAMQAAVARHDAILRQAVEAHHGTVFKTVGDAFYAAFSTAAEALEAALEGQRALATEHWDPEVVPRVRMALHTGTAEERDNDYFGPDLNRIARLLAAGHGEQILLSGVTQALVREHLPDSVELRDLGRHDLKDLSRPEHIYQAVAPELRADFPPLKTIDVPRTNLPPDVTAFIGRKREVEAVTALLRKEDIRLLVLTGPGGTGKTRLAVKVGREHLDAFGDGVFFVSLAPLTDPTLVAPTIARVFSVDERGSEPSLNALLEYLREQHMLLILDNFEHLPDATSVVEELLNGSPLLKMLITSRSVLHLYGEHDFPVPTLSVPAPAATLDIGSALEFDAVALFVARAKAVKPDFALTNENVPAAAAICRQLDGLPLAIELAAARVRILSPQEIVSRLSSSLSLLTSRTENLPARQQTLRGTIDWSYGLLSPEEQLIFTRLAVFAGGFTLAAAEAVCTVDGDLTMGILDGVASLVDKSLVQAQQDVGGGPRFTMLETIHEYADERLAASGETAVLKQQHATNFLRLAQEADPQMYGTERDVWMDRLDREEANLRAALAWSTADKDGTEIGLRLAGALGFYWFLHDAVPEGRAWLEGLLEQTDAGDWSAVRGRALLSAGWLAWDEGDYVAASPRAEESLAIARAGSDKRELAFSELLLGLIRMGQRNSLAARHLLEEARTLFQDLGDRWGEADTLYYLGMAAHLSGDRAAARAYFEEGLRLFQEHGDTFGVALLVSALEAMGLPEGDEETARSLYEQSLPLLRASRDRGRLGMLLVSVGDTWLHHYGNEQQAKTLYQQSLNLSRDMQRLEHGIGTVRAVAGLAEVAAAQGQAERAGTLFGIADRMLPAASSYRDELNSRVADIRSRVDGGEFTAGWTAGQGMSEQQAIDYALQESPIGDTTTT